MQARLRSTVAAALLLAPALAFVSPPAAAQQRATAQPSIGAMALNSDAGLSPGATLRVQVQATPRAGRASITLGDSGITIPLAQKEPGKYSGTHVIRRSDRIDPLQHMTARLTYGERVHSRQFSFPPAFQALSMGARGAPRDAAPPPRVAARDQRSPDILDLFPPHGDRVSERGGTRIAARLADAGSGVDPSSVRLRLNGQDVTADARVTEDRVVLREDLAPGRYTAEVTVRDQTGNLTRKAWIFDVEERGRGDRFGDSRRDRDQDRGRVAGRDGGSGPFPLALTSHSHNMVVDARGNLAIQGRTVPHATVRLQVDAPGAGAPLADRTVQADSEGRFQVRVEARGPIRPGERYDVRVRASSGPETAEERITLIQRG